MTTTESISRPATLPPADEMYAAILRRDPDYDGVFFLAVTTTGIVCRPTCPARKPKAENIEYFASVRDALFAGYRPCRRCRPLEPAGTPPEWLRPVLERVEADPEARITDADLRRDGVEPARVRRWFVANHGITFHAYQRARRLGLALGRVRLGDDVTAAAYAHGFESLSGFREAFRRVFDIAPGSAKHVAAPILVTRILTPLGPMVAGANDDGIALLEFAERRRLERQVRTVSKRLETTCTPGDHEWLRRLEAQLAEYFDGKRTTFDLPLVLPGTDFQRDVWAELRDIASGETRSYDAIARAIGRPKAVRAVGRANGDNRVAILVPCHRVIGADGKLTGYGGGLWRKQALLELEARTERPART